MTDRAERLLKRAVDAGVSPGELHQLVTDYKVREATALTQCGLEPQLEYLCNVGAESDVAQYLEQYLLSRKAAGRQSQLFYEDPANETP